METTTKRKRRRRLSNKSNGPRENPAGEEAKRQKLLSKSAQPQPNPINLPKLCPPPSGQELDRLNYHIDLQDFARGLQHAANAVFAGDRRCRYTHVSALLLSWEDEDPQLPVSLEINALKDVFISLYDFDVEEYQIPAINSHIEVNLRILTFLKDSNARHLKIVYYAGHGKLSKHGQALWTSRRNILQDRCPTVKWSGIQTACEESPSDVLILLDCCASGMSNTDEGNGVTELTAACAFNNTANGVGPFSFTHTLISQLRKSFRMPSFNVAYLYNLIFTAVQGWQVEDPKYKKVPVHLVLTQDYRLPRSITISSKRSQSSPQLQPPISSSGLSLLNAAPTPESLNSYGTPVTQSSSPADKPFETGGDISPSSSNETSPRTSPSQLPEYPRLLFSIRISGDIKPRQLSTDLFADWLGSVPIAADRITIEAGFASDSTLLIISMPIELFAYLPREPAITLLGVSRSANLFTMESENFQTMAAADAGAVQEMALTGFGKSCDRCGTLRVQCNATEKSVCARCSKAGAECRFTGDWNLPEVAVLTIRELENMYHQAERENSCLQSRLEELDKLHQYRDLTPLKEPGGSPQQINEKLYPQADMTGLTSTSVWRPHHVGSAKYEHFSIPPWPESEIVEESKLFESTDSCDGCREEEAPCIAYGYTICYRCVKHNLVCYPQLTEHFGGDWNLVKVFKESHLNLKEEEPISRPNDPKTSNIPVKNKGENDRQNPSLLNDTLLSTRTSVGTVAPPSTVTHTSVPTLQTPAPVDARQHSYGHRHYGRFSTARRHY